MKLSELVPEGGIVTSLKGPTRDAAVGELVDALCAAGAASAADRDELVAKVLDRERKGSTGFGQGIAVPHVKHKSVRRIAAAVGLSAGGIDFTSLDRQPVYSIVLLLSPEDQPDPHLEAMKVIFDNLSKPTFRRFLRQAGTVQDVRVLLEEADAALGGSGPMI
ncbi:MAG: PTS sugar transporter subunit IIA [Phycisphaerales bacterium]